MRTLTLSVAMGSVAWMLAGPAAAANSVSLVWSAASGTSSTGTSEISAGAGDTLTLDIVVHIDTEGLAAFSISLAYESDRLFMIGFTECAGFIIPGACVTSGLQLLNPAMVGVTFDNVGPLATAHSWDGFDVSAPYETVPQSLTVGTAVFVVQGPPEFGTAVTTAYLPGVDGLLDGMGKITTPAAQAICAECGAPEPGTLGLLALGLLILAGARRT